MRPWNARPCSEASFPPASLPLLLTRHPSRRGAMAQEAWPEFGTGGYGTTARLADERLVQAGPQRVT